MPFARQRYSQLYNISIFYKIIIALVYIGTHLEADEEGERHGYEDEEPAEDGKDPSADPDSGVAVIRCFVDLN